MNAMDVWITHKWIGIERSRKIAKPLCVDMTITMIYQLQIQAIPVSVFHGMMIGSSMLLLLSAFLNLHFFERCFVMSLS